MGADPDLEKIQPESDPEVATTPEWRRDMKRARERLEITQKALAVRLGCKQAMVSQLENGTIRASKFVLPICRILAIAPPTHFMIEEQREWSRLGHLLQSGDREAFALELVGLRQAVARLEKAEQEKQELRDALAFATKRRGAEPAAVESIAAKSSAIEAPPLRPRNATKKKTG